MAKRIIGLAALLIAQLAYSQAPPSLTIGENTKLNAGALFTAGYSGDYGDAIPSDHGLTLGGSGQVSGYYYNPNFLSFSATPYYNQSRADSTSQSLTAASGVAGTANFFTGSKFPGAVSYHYDRDSSGTFGLTGQPNFTTIGTGDGFSINWSALVPDWPTLSVGYAQGSGGGTIFGTSEQATSSTKLLNIHSNYSIAGFRLNASYGHNSLNSEYPEFLTGEGDSQQDSSGQNFGFGVQHSLPIHGSFYANIERSSFSGTSSGGGSIPDQTSYTDDIENAGASFHPTQKLSFNLTENYTSDLSGYLSQSLSSGGNIVPVNLGSGSHSTTMAGGIGYLLTQSISASAVATHYDQFYFGQDYTGTFLSGTLAGAKRLFNMFSFSASVLDSSDGNSQNTVGFVGNLNFSHRVLGWQTAAQFTYAQNAQTLLATYTTSYYNYSANVRRWLSRGWSWTGAFTGSHSGLSNDAGSASHGEGFSSSIGSSRFTLTGSYSESAGVSLIAATGLVGLPPTPGINNYITFTGDSYNGAISVTPIRRLIISGAFARAISNTTSQTFSHNDTEIFNGQLQYHLRRIGLQAGYTRFTQGISAVGAPASTTSFFMGFSRWFDFF
ncbi:MAG: hypothetical protein WBS24_16545 [Terriglobales bacterium]